MNKKAATPLTEGSVVKNRILLRLILYFAASFAIFAIIISIMFSTLLSRHNIDVHMTELENRAVNIANSFSGIIDSGLGGWYFYGFGDGIDHTVVVSRGLHSLGAFLYFTEEIAMTDVWIIDHNLDQINFGRRTWGLGSYSDLPTGAEQVVLDAIAGKTSVSQNFSALLDVPTITVATPIILANGEIMGVVLLHSEVSNVNEVTYRGLTLFLFSMAAAVIVAFIIAVILSSRFIKPLNRMKQAALHISEGDYLARTGVVQSDEIGELALILDDMADRLNKSSKEGAKLEKLRRDFVANISHELRTPLTVIRGSLESLCDGIVTDAKEVTEYHTQMLSESKYLDRLVSDLLDLARLQNLDFAIEVQEIDLKYIADDVVRSMRHIAERRNIEIVPTFEGENFMILGDYGRIRQMLIIILDNAIKFSPEGKTVEVSLICTGATIEVSVRDEGYGIHSDDLPYIFERFYKHRSEENKSGTGLGLAIAKQIVDRHGASVHVESEQGKGAKFIFEFETVVTP